MAGSPQFKVYDANGEYIGCVKYAEDAAVLVGICGRGDGAKVKWQHTKTVWTQGEDGDAAESYDAAAETINGRLAQYQRDSYVRNTGRQPA